MIILPLSLTKIKTREYNSWTTNKVLSNEALKSFLKAETDVLKKLEIGENFWRVHQPASTEAKRF